MTKLHWHPDRYGSSVAEANGVALTVSYALKQPPEIGKAAWTIRSEGISQDVVGSRQDAQAALEGLVRDRLIKALAAFDEQEGGG